MNELINILGQNLDIETRERLMYRIDAMMRTINFLKERSDERLMWLFEKGWTIESLSTIFCLNSFYQLVLGPLVSSTISIHCELGRAIPIQWGEVVTFDKKRAIIIEEMYDEFYNNMNELDIDFWWLQAASAEDIVYRISQNSGYE